MHATSTPTLAQPKPSAFGAIAAVALAVGIAAGAIAAVNLAPTSGTATSGAAIRPTGAGLSLQRNGETGALTPAERALKLQRQGEIGAGAAAITAPASTSLGGRDPMAYWNAYSLVGPSSMDVLRAAGGWYAFPPAAAEANTKPVGISHR